MPLCTSFFSCLFFGIELGMVIGIATNLCCILYGIARPSIQLSWLMVHNILFSKRLPHDEKNFISKCFQVNNQKVIQVIPKQNLLFPSSGHIRELIIEECKKRDDYSPVVIDGSHIYNVDSTTAKVRKINVNSKIKTLHRIFEL